MLALPGWLTGLIMVLAVVLAVACFAVCVWAVWFNDERGE